MSTLYKYILLLLVVALAAGIVIPKAFFHDAVAMEPAYRACATLGVHEILGNPIERIIIATTGQTVIAGQQVDADPDGRLVAKTDTYIFFGGHYATTLVSCYKDSEGKVSPGSVSTVRWWRGDGQVTARKY